MKSIINSKDEIGIYFETNEEVLKLKNESYFNEVENLGGSRQLYFRLSYDSDLKQRILINHSLFNLKKTNMIDIRLGSNSLENLINNKEIISIRGINEGKVTIFPASYFNKKNK